MSRYIDADKFIAHLKDEIKECEVPFGSRANGKSIAYGTTLGLNSAISFAETLSTADVVEVVRCKDCKHWGGTTYGFICRRFSGITMKNCTKPDAFCSDGERRAEE